MFWALAMQIELPCREWGASHSRGSLWYQWCHQVSPMNGIEIEMLTSSDQIEVIMKFSKQHWSVWMGSKLSCSYLDLQLVQRELGHWYGGWKNGYLWGLGNSWSTLDVYLNLGFSSIRFVPCWRPFKWKQGKNGHESEQEWRALRGMECLLPFGSFVWRSQPELLVMDRWPKLLIGSRNRS